MTTIRQLFPDYVNNNVGYAFGKISSFLQYYYDDTFDANEIYDGIFIGGLSSSMNKTELQKRGITHIISVLNGCSETYGDVFNYKIIHVNDDNWVTLIDHFDECIDFINNAKKNNTKVLVHCRKGVSRSVTVVISYLMVTHKISFEEALNIVRKKRPLADPNPGFRKQLIDYGIKKGIYDEKFL